MGELELRLIVVGAVVVVGFTIAALARRGTSLRRRSAPSGLAPGLYVFVSDSCSTCRRVEGMVSEITDGGYHRVSWEEEPERFRTLGIERVPVTVRVRRDGGGWAAAGVPSRARLSRWLAEGA